MCAPTLRVTLTDRQVASRCSRLNDRIGAAGGSHLPQTVYIAN